MTAPRISVVIATRNPRRDALEWTLDALAQQTLAKSQFEIVIADNGSSPPLDISLSQGLRLRIVREPRSGVTFARCTGILAAEADLIIFADDDNALDPNYLEESLRIAAASPSLGAFGGIARLRCDTPVAPWKEKLLPYLGVRDYGPDVITSTEDAWGPWEPIGAGMVFRRNVGLEFVRVVQTDPLAQTLGRRGKSFICGEDALLARMSLRLGYSLSYQPTLKLTHWISAGRLSAVHLAKTVEGVARAFVIYETVLGRPQPDPQPFRTLRELAGRLRHRTSLKGLRAGTIEWFWDIGYFRHCRLLHRLEERRNGREVLHRHSEL